MSEDPNKDYNTTRMAHFYEDARINNRGAIEFGIVGLRSLFLVNGGAMLAMLTFVGNVCVTSEAVLNYRLAFLCFGIGISSALIATFCSYFSQGVSGVTSIYDADGIYFAQINRKQASDEIRTEAGRERRVSNRFRYSALGFALISGLLFIVGMLVAVEAIISSNT